MKTIKIIENGLDPRYLTLFLEKYNDEKQIEYFLSDIKNSAEYTKTNENLFSVILEEGDDLLGHCSVIPSKNKGVAYFGFFEFPNDAECFQSFWDHIVCEAKKRSIKKIVGPINGSIWFPYRFISKRGSTELFKGELPTEAFYHDFFSAISNQKVISFSSGKREEFQSIIAATKKAYDVVEKTDLKIESLSEVSGDILKEIYTLAEEIFSFYSVAYEAFPIQYFFELYNTERMKDIFNIYTVREKGKLVGFCSVFHENEKTIILKTLAVHPSFQQHGIGGALAYLVHRDAQKQGIQTIVYGLVRDDNNIRFFPKDDVSIIRTYSLFEIDI
jgi:ribosomal protein S18 acetylase RimI-like enzyme